MRNNKKTNPLLVIVGMAGSGKSSVAQHLQKKGWRVIRFGAITIDEVKSRGLPVNEANEKSVREELRAKHGMDAYARLSLPGIKDSLVTKPTIIDGLYSWSEYKSLKKRFGKRMVVIAVFTPRSIRYDRLARRPERPLTFKEAEQRDFAEIEKVEKGGPLALADYTIINDGTEKDLCHVLDRLLSTLDILGRGGTREIATL